MEQKQKQTRKEYMREYKRKQYQQHGEKIKEDNRMYYYKNKNNVSLEKMKEYKCDCFGTVSKLLSCMEYLKQSQPEILDKIMQEYMKELQ